MRVQLNLFYRTASFYGNDDFCLADDNPEQEGDYFSLCSYNHLSHEESNKVSYNMDYYVDEETKMGFKPFVHFCLNSIAYDEIIPCISKYIGDEYTCIANHEQYFYSDYFGYQPDYAEKMYKMCEYLTENGYEFIFLEDLIK